MIEEMLHMTLVRNLTSALGGHIHVGPRDPIGYPLSLNFEGSGFEIGSSTWIWPRSARR